MSIGRAMEGRRQRKLFLTRKDTSALTHIADAYPMPSEG